MHFQALIKLEPQLNGLSSYHVRTAALHVFDCAVDKQSSWQRQSTVSLFLDVLGQLDRNLAEKRMPHFFFPSVDLFADVPPQTLGRWRARVHCLAESRAELMRVLRRRTENHRMIAPGAGSEVF
jgi:Mab-21 protein